MEACFFGTIPFDHATCCQPLFSDRLRTAGGEDALVFFRLPERECEGCGAIDENRATLSLFAISP
jgi:hypothetical protein